MKSIYLLLSCYSIFLIGGLFLSGCKEEKGHAVQPTDENYIPKGNLADLAYNPIRADGTIDSSYIPITKWDEVVFDFGTI